MKDYKFKSSPKLDSMIKSILANTRFSSFQELIENRLHNDYAQVKAGRKIS
jgi:hypothetical protein